MTEKELWEALVLQGRDKYEASAICDAYLSRFGGLAPTPGEWVIKDLDERSPAYMFVRRDNNDEDGWSWGTRGNAARFATESDAVEFKRGCRCMDRYPGAVVTKVPA